MSEGTDGGVKREQVQKSRVYSGAFSSIQAAMQLWWGWGRKEEKTQGVRGTSWFFSFSAGHLVWLGCVFFAMLRIWVSLAGTTEQRSSGRGVII